MATSSIRRREESIYFSKLSICILGYCTDMLIDLLKKNVKPKDLKDLVQRYLFETLHKDHIEKLYSPDVPNYGKFDINLLYILLKTPEICSSKISTPSKGWGMYPESEQCVSVGDDIERIKGLKDFLCSRDNDRNLTEDEYKDRLRVIQGIAKRFDSILETNGKYLTEVNVVAEEPLKWEIKELNTKLTLLKSQDEENETGIPKEILDMGEEAITLYVEALKNGKIKVYHIRGMVVGPQGVGKTVLTERLLEIDVDLNNRQSTNSIETHIHKCVLSIPDGQWIVHPENVRNTLRVGRKIGNCLVEYRKLERNTEKGTDEPAQVVKDQLVLDEANAETTSGSISAPSERETSEEKIIDPFFEETTFEDTRDYIQSDTVNLCETGEVSLWDFGGHFVFYATHHTYLTPRAVYIVVLDMSKALDDEVVDEEIIPVDPQCSRHWSYKDYLLYWLNTIRNLAKGAPVIFVATHLDRCQGTNIDKYFDNVVSTLIKEDESLFWTRECQYFAVDNTIHDTTIQNLQRAIFENAVKQENWGETIPAKWAVLEDHLKKEEKKIVTLNEIVQLDSKTRSPIHNKSEILLFLQFQHDLGNLIFFEELSDCIVLDPKWLIKAFRCIITSAHFSKGRMAQPHWHFLADTGQLNENILEMLLQKSEDFIRHKKEITDLLDHLKIIARPSVNLRQQRKEMEYYFVPSMLKTKATNREFLLTQSSSAIMVYKLPKHLAPVAFNLLLGHIISTWPVSIDIHEKPTLHSGFGMFDVDDKDKGSKKLVISLSDDVIQLQILSDKSMTEFNHCLDVRQYVDVMLAKVLQLPKLRETQHGGVKIYHCIKCPLSATRFIEVEQLFNSPVYSCEGHRHFSRHLLKYWFNEEKIEDMEKKRGSNIHEYQKNIQELLLDAVNKNLEDDILHIVSGGANICASDKSGQLAIHHAAKIGNQNIVQILLGNDPGYTEKNSTQFVRDVHGKTPIFYAVENKHLEVVRYFLQSGSSVTNLDAKGKSLLHYAVTQNNDEMIEYLAEYEQQEFGILEVCLRQISIAIETSNHSLGNLVLEPLLDMYFKNKQAKSLDQTLVMLTKTVLKKVCQDIKEKHPTNIIKVSPVYEDHQRGPVAFVLYVSDIPDSRIKYFMGLKAIYRIYDYVNEEARVILCSKEVQEHPIQHEEYMTVKKIIDEHALSLRYTHSNLRFISVSTVKSSNKGKDLTPTTCIALHCRYKGWIPFGERLFPTKIENYITDIREGYVELFSHVNNNDMNPVSQELHETLRLGCSISRETQHVPWSGTIGGFIAIENETYFLTCAHVLFTPEDLIGNKMETDETDQEEAKVYQPADSDPTVKKYNREKRLCGTVVNWFFQTHGNVTVDAALVKICNDREPDENQIIGLNTFKLKRCGFDNVPNISNITVPELSDISGFVQQTVFKIGSVSGITKGVIKLHGTRAFRSSEEELRLPDEEGTLVQVRGQIEIEPVGQEPFFMEGDSGSLVFMKIGDAYICLGMAIGARSDGVTLVTPMNDILQCLQLPASAILGYEHN